MNQIMMHGALQLNAAGYDVFLLKNGTKQHAFRNPRRLSRFEIMQNMRFRLYNVGVALGDGLMVVDQDSPDAIAYCEANGLKSDMEVVTSRGSHLYFQTRKEITNKINHLKMKCDLLFHGYVVAPPSIIADTEHRYTFKNGLVPRQDLPFFPNELIPKPEPLPLQPVSNAVSNGKVKHLSAYLRKIRSIQGQSGSRAFWRVCCVIADNVEHFDEGLAELYIYNVSGAAEPPWSAEECQRTLRRAYERKGAKV